MAIDISNFAKAADATGLRLVDRDLGQPGIYSPTMLNPPNVELTAIVSGSPLPASIAYGSLVSQAITVRVALRES